MVSQESSSSEKQSNTKLDKFRYQADRTLWKSETFEDTINLEGKRLHLIQLPQDLPLSCLDGVEIPNVKKGKWSKSIKINHTDNSDEEHVLEVKGYRLTNQSETVMQVVDGKLIPCKSPLVNMYHAFGVTENAEVCLPEISESSVHVLPAGLRQRYTPTGNGRVAQPTPIIKHAVKIKREKVDADKFEETPPKKHKKSKSKRDKK